MYGEQQNAQEYWKDERVSSLYAVFRPSYPDEIFEHLVSLVNTSSSTGEKVAVDIGCGSGQATQKLTPYFDKVFGVDPSQAQISCATQNEKITYVCASAEHTSLPDQCADAILVAQALHWFDLEEFWKEVNRLLKPGGVFAAITYELARFENQAAEQALAKLYNGTLAKYWDPRRKLVETRYETIAFPFPLVQRKTFSLVKDTTIADYCNMVNTWSAVSKFKAQFPHSTFMDDFKCELLAAYQTSNDKLPITTTWEMPVVFGRK